MDLPLTEKLALNIREVTALTGVCRTELYEVIAAGALRARKRGASTLVLQADLRAWLDGLPIAPSAASKVAGAGEAVPAAEMDAAPALAPEPAPKLRRRRLTLIGQRT